MADPKIFTLNDQDKLRYLKLIEKINPENKYEIIRILGQKVQLLIDEKKINSIELELINDMSNFVEVLEKYPNLPENIVKKILFAMSYFIDDNDEIPDVIPKYGYLDDIAVVKWIIQEIHNSLPEVGVA
ncbi:MAG: hypothetical protein CMG55_04905 [Candidatus Marinimicrobia bacterium]|nr:hypothetical protein [Candidatus Neomarinimicrobiota bacterium]|tara:strand:+ start:2826 stop:3212 length:387 start_codon:yes stop_codon:yes gene_type:complete